MATNEPSDINGDNQAILENKKEKISKPPLYKVIMINDDFTTMIFVIEILMAVFNKTIKQAEEITLEIHNEGRGICGVYTQDIAQTKVAQVTKAARENNFPLKLIIEQE